ncbi:MAG: DUF2723 domain-containing protein [Anaerolineae bacterium]|nr:DUF2723 domain-containing protein [Anaerolineae bacterium]
MLVLAGAAFAVLYWSTLAPGVLPADSGEFQRVAAEPGVAHPPGFALYTLLAHAMTLLPIGPTIAYRVNLLSAIFTVLMLLVVYATTFQLTQSNLAALISAVALGTATTVWSQATTANVRALTALLAALAFYTLIRYRDAEGETAKRRWLIAFALAVGFGITHHLSLVFMAVFWMLYLWLIDGRRHLDRWRRALPWGLLGLLPLLYLPLTDPDLRTPGAFFNYVLALGFRGDFFGFSAPDILLARLRVMMIVLQFQFLAILLLGILLGLIVVTMTDWRLSVLLSGAFLSHMLVTAIYRAPQTVEYMLPAYIPAVIAFGCGLSWWWVDLGDKWQIAAGSLLIAALALAFFQGAQNRSSYTYLHHDYSAENYAAVILEGAPENAMVLANWHWVTPLWYLQQVEGRRPDLIIDYVEPGSEPYAETWAAEIAGALQAGHDVVATDFDEFAFAALPPAEPLGDAFLYSQTPRVTLPASFTPFSTQLNEAVEVVGYMLDRDSAEIWSDVYFTIAWQPLTETADATLFAHLISADGRLWAQDDLTVRAQPEGLTLTRFRLTPRPGTIPDIYTIAIGGSAVGDTTENPSSRVSVTRLRVTPMSILPFTQNTVIEKLANGDTVRGYDWDLTYPNHPRLYVHTQLADGGFVTTTYDSNFQQIGSLTLRASDCKLPCNYIPFGQGIVWYGNSFAPDDTYRANRTVVFSNYFGSSIPLTRDYVVGNALIGLEADETTWAWVTQNDGIPALGAIPTLKWISGSQVSEQRNVKTGANAVAGQTMVATLRLYDAFTKQPLAVLDEVIVAAAPWVEVGRMTIK